MNQEQSLTLSPAWVFFVADGETDDPPVYLFDDSNDRTYRQVARSLWEFVESLVIDYEIWSDSGLLRS